MPILAETVHKNRVKPAGDTLKNDSYMDGPVFCPQVRFVIAATTLDLSQEAKKRLSSLDRDQRVSEIWSWHILASVFMNFSPKVWLAHLKMETANSLFNFRS